MALLLHTEELSGAETLQQQSAARSCCRAPEELCRAAAPLLHRSGPEEKMEVAGSAAGQNPFYAPHNTIHARTIGITKTKTKTKTKPLLRFPQHNTCSDQPEARVVSIFALIIFLCGKFNMERSDISHT